MTIVITVAPAGSGRYSASLDGRVLVPSAREPLLAAARVLLAEGVDPSTMLVMKHAGSETVCLTARLGFAAGLAVVETASVGPRFARYQPLDREMAFPSTAGPRQAPPTDFGHHPSPDEETASERVPAETDA